MPTWYGHNRLRISPELQLATPVLLAPMAAVTDLPFRTVCEEQGAILTFTEFLSADALTRGAHKTLGRNAAATPDVLA